MSNSTKDRNRKRRAYDQAREPRAARPQQRNDVGYTGYSSSHPITNPNFDPDAPRPTRYSGPSSGYPDNSIQFPTGGRSAQEQGRPRTQSSNAPRRKIRINGKNNLRMRHSGTAAARAARIRTPRTAKIPSGPGTGSVCARHRPICGTPPAARARKSGS